ncbi:MAG TPA: bifunctional UDP-N-acetylmuramoyl-tripeptide:D-alanyl-D-alanine ligase/alanine racemase [Flavobacterium sp.]|nr:bifunctional UDP-N-acetylmuramoyl-tripeptide:D-alanyl-D-alanine ligase/alanine racemase [Flavobacterium sp.]
MNFSVDTLAKQMQAEYFANQEVIDIIDVSVDSRSLQNRAGVLFFALTGENHDGHAFIPALLEQNVSYFVVEKLPERLPENTVFFLVKNTRKALQDFAAFYRRLYDFPVIGITGSNGKTIVKEWLSFLLTPFYQIIKSPKSYNSQIGVPLSVFGINDRHNLGVFEAGISLPNEMDKLERIIQPNIGILTSIGSSHDEGFLHTEQKIKEKIKLFAHCNMVVVPYMHEVIAELPAQAMVWSYTFEKNNKAKVYFELKDNQLIVSVDENKFIVDIPFTDKASVQNIATCITTLLAMNVDITYIQTQIPKLFKVNMRLQVVDGQRDCTIIDDSYSSDYQSLKIALDFLEQQRTHKSKTVIISDIYQSGFPDDVLYEKISHLLAQNQINRVIGIGARISRYLVNTPNLQCFPDTASFLRDYNLQSFRNETILIKGARKFAFERIVTELEEKTHETVLEINLDAISENLNFYRSKIKPETKVMVMVKAFGYGNGSYEIAKLLAHQKVDYLGVAFADEGVELRKAGIKIPIIVMNPEPSTFSTLIAYQLEPEIYSLTELKRFADEVKKSENHQYPVHIKLNTGMNRLGFKHNDLPELIAYLKNTQYIAVQSIFSHLAASDDISQTAFTLQQIAHFDDWSKQLMTKLDIRPIRHILNTSGIYNFSAHQFDMVRLGIGLYGVGNHPEENQKLKNVAKLKTVILQINEIENGESVGYGRRFTADKFRRIATIPIGYADGIRRSYGNEKGFVLVHGQRAKIVGTICMDMLMIDVSDISANEGDEVVIFDENLRITEVAKIWETIPYEVMTSISQRVKRVFYKE